MRRGLEAFSQGFYEEAEDLFKRALELNPYLALANVALGKVFLLRGSATQDASVLADACRMFEMACSLDSSLKEAEDLLQLVATSCSR